MLREQLVKGFVLDDPRLEDPSGTDYFDELLQRIPASKLRFYQKVRDRLTTMFLDFAEDRAQRRQATLMAEWVTQTDWFLDFNERTLLSGPGSVSASRMKQVVAERYGEFDQHRRAVEAERAEADELDDLRALTEIENRRPGAEGDRDGHQPR